MGTRPIRALIWMGVLASLSCALRAQEPSKTVSVTIEVKDQSGAAIPNALVKIAPSPNSGKNLTTGNDGRASLDMPSGSYDLSVTFPGFSHFTKRIEIQNGAPELVFVVLEPGNCSQGCGVVTDVSPVSFPERSQAISPDGRYVLLNVDSDEKPYHTVFLEDRILNTRRKLLNYERHASFLWRYDSKLFAVTDYVGSDNSRCSVLSVDEKIPPIEVVDQLFQQLSENGRERLKNQLSNNHAYVEASVWLGPTLRLKVSGYGDADPSGFAEFYNLHVQLGPP